MRYTIPQMRLGPACYDTPCRTLLEPPVAMPIRFLLAVLLLIPTSALRAAPPQLALGPKDVIVVANKDSKDSLAVAAHYCAKRNVPKENMVALSLPTGEDISRADYEAKLAGPLRDALKEKKDAAKVILCVTGVPLRVGPKVPTADEKEALAKLDTEIAEAKKADDKPGEARLTAKKRRLAGSESQAAVDSELMLLWWPKYELDRWVVNPLYWQVPDAERKKSERVLLTARLDGPTVEIAERLVDDAIETEEKGLKGKAYFDARGFGFDPKKDAGKGTGYEGYDASFREAGELLKKAGMDVVIDDKPELFGVGKCPDAAFYAGWYSHANFIASGTYTKGSVAWHLASSEAVSLRRADSKVWCPNLLKAGVCATLGPVAEPYTVAFPKPAEFFGFLATGKYTLVEVYANTTLITSWMMTLVGDPLYNPYAKSPLLKEADVEPSPKGFNVLRGK